MARTVGVVVPAYDPDVDVLAGVIDALDAELSPDSLRVELDAPGPGVEDVLEGTAATIHVSGARRGKGAAVTDGFDALGTDVLAFVDADGSVPPHSLAEVIEPVSADRADLAVGSRRHPDADVRSHQTFARRLLGDGFAFVARLLLDVPLYDYQCGAKAIDRETWEAVSGHLSSPGFAWDVELVGMAGALGARIEEVPVVWIDRPGSTVDTLGTTYALGRTLLSTRRRAARLRVPAGDATDRPGDAPRIDGPPGDDD